MQLSVPNVVDTTSAPVASPAHSAPTPGGDGKPTPAGAFGDVLTAALGTSRFPTPPDAVNASTADGTSLPPTGTTPPLPTATTLDALLAALVAPPPSEDAAPETDPNDVTAGIAGALANIPVEVQPVIGSLAIAVLPTTGPTATAEQQTSQQIELRELQALRDALAGALSKSAGNSSAGAAADHRPRGNDLPRDLTVVAPSVAAFTADRPQVQGADASAGSALDSAALLKAAALDGAQAVAAHTDSGADQPGDGPAHQSLPANSVSAAGRGTFAALADSFMHGQSTDIAANLAHRIQWMAQHGLQSARIAVTPRELGPIDIQLLQSDGGLSVSITAQHPATRELLDASASRLREMFIADGTLLQHFDVGGGGRDNREHDAERFARADSSSETDALPAAPPVRIQLSLIDAYA